MGECALSRPPRRSGAQQRSDRTARVGGVGMAPTTTGGASSYYEDYLYNSQIIAPAQVLSLVAEGVFERHPSIRVVLSELGFGWIPSLMWRYDKDWKALWRETPWVHERPSAYIKRHFRATTSPTQSLARHRTRGRAVRRDARGERVPHVLERLPPRPRGGREREAPCRSRHRRARSGAPR